MVPDNKRRPLPRWHSPGEAGARGELRSQKKIAPSVVSHSRDFEQLLAHWRSEKSIETAADLAAAALVLGRVQEAEQAAIHLTRQDIDVAPAVRRIAERLLDTHAGKVTLLNPGSFNVDRADVHAKIAHQRLRVRASPRNALAWMELARWQTILGQHKPAGRAVRIALTLAPENRYVLRSATRFFIHNGKPQHALTVLRSTQSLRTDPWLMSAELSVSMVANVDPRSYRLAKALAEEDRLDPWHTSELHGALGTMALIDRSVGKVGKLFRRSLREPTENAVAQAQWASNSSSAVDVPDRLVTSGHTAEALALRARAQSNWTQVIEACLAWGAMEPTSARPLVLGAFCAGAALGDGGAMLQFTQRLLLGASSVPMVLNNHAVALAYVGRLDEAQSTLDSIHVTSLDDHLRVFYEATRGLISYRRGDRDAGMQQYLKAAALPGSQQNPDVASQVLWHLLREEARLQVPGTKELAEMLVKKTEKVPIPELRGLRDSVFQLIAMDRRAGDIPETSGAALSRDVIAYFPDGTSLTVRPPD